MALRPNYNVLMLGWEFYPVFAGGMGVVTAEIVKGLTDKNISVHFVIPKLPQKIELNKVQMTSAQDYVPTKDTYNKYIKSSDLIQKTYIDTAFFPYETKNILTYKTYEEMLKQNHIGTTKSAESFSSSTNKLYSENIIREIRLYEDKAAQIALESEFDVIHAHDWITFRGAIKAKKLTGKPVVLHVHATEIDRSGESPNNLVFDIEKECLQQADYVIAVSNKGKADIIKYYKIPEDKIFVLHNSTNFSQDHKRTILSNEDKIVLFLGRLTMQKGPEYFIQSAAKVLKYDPKVKFIMVGDGDAYTRSIDLVNDLGIEKNFIFTGFLTGEDKNRLYASADLFVMPSVSEPFGVVALEAIKSGTPVIVSKTSGAAEIIHNALKVDFWDIEKTANYIYSVLNRKSLKEQLKNMQTEDLNSQNWNHQIDVLCEIYELASSNTI